MKLCSMFLILFSTAWLSAAQPVAPPKPDVVKAVTLTLPKTMSVVAGKKCVITATTTAKKVTWKVPTDLDVVVSDGKTIYVWATPGVYTIAASVPSGDDVVSTEMVLTLIGPKLPPPAPPEPGPTPTPVIPPAPAPVTSFRVIFVHESGSTLPLGQTPISDAKAIRDYLTATTTPEGQWAGFRKYDKDQVPTDETPAMKALWAAVQPKLTAIPCIVVEVNGKADIIPYPASATEALAILKKYNGGK